MGSFGTVLCIGVGLFVLFWAYDRWILPVVVRWRAKRSLANMEPKLVQDGPPPLFSITIDDGGFTIAAVQNPSFVPISRQWSEVLRVTAFKQDLGTVDLICVAFEFEQQSALELDEEMGGWTPFVDALPAYLTGCRPHSEWFAEVAFPAFATNVTSLYSRGTGLLHSRQ